MLIEGNKIMLFAAELLNHGISEDTIKKGMMRNRIGYPSWAHRSWDVDKRIKLIDYDSLPEATKKKLPSKGDLMQQNRATQADNRLEEYHETCEALSSLIQNTYQITDYHFFLAQVDKQKAADLATAASILRFLEKYNSKKDTLKIRYESKAALRVAVVDFLIKEADLRGRPLYSFKITNPAVLQRKELSWKNAFQQAFNHYSNTAGGGAGEPKLVAEKKAYEAALATLINNNIGNINAMIIGRPSDVEDENIFIPGTNINLREFHANKLMNLYMLPGRANKLDFEQIYIRYFSICNQEGYTPCDLSTVKKFLSRQEVKLYAIRERDGMKAYDKLLPHVKRTKPQYSLSKGGYDGFQVDFYTKTDKGQVMLTVVAVFDYMSEAITGYDVGIVEDGLMVRNMYRNHLNTTGGKSYIEIESDRFSGNLAASTKAIFEQCCKYITQPAPNDPHYTKAPNPKARYVERLIQEFNRLTQSFPGWKGTNFYTKDASRRPNQDLMENTAVPTIEEGIQQIITLINIYNNQEIKKFNGKSRMDMFLENQNPEAPEIPTWSMAMILNQQTTTTVRNGVVEITVNRRKYEYLFEDYQRHISAMLKGMKVNVYFDENNMETVDVFGKNDIHLGTLPKLIRINPAKAEQKENDLKEWGRQIGRRNKSRNEIDRKALEVIAADLDIDISGMDIKEARELVKGAAAQRETDLLGEAFYEPILQTAEAQTAANYYEDRLLRFREMQVPVETKSNEQARRDYIRNKRNRS